MNSETTATDALSIDIALILRSLLTEGATGKGSVERLLLAKPDEFCRVAVSMLTEARSVISGSTL